MDNRRADNPSENRSQNIDMESNLLPTTVLTSRIESNQRILVELAEFWKIPYTTRINQERNTIVFSSGGIDQSKANRDPIIVSPAGPGDFARIASDHGLRLETSETLLQVPVTKDCKALVRAMVNEFVGPRLQTLLFFNGKRILSRIEGSRIHLLSLDLIAEYTHRLYEGLEDTPSARFRTMSKLPIPYSIVPSSLRNWSLRRALNNQDRQEETMGAVECLRAIFLASLETVSGRPIPRIAFWRPGKSYSMAMTHDVETRTGLLTGVPQLLGIEKDLGVRSTWNIPSDRYHLSSRSLREIAEAGDIGAHDTVHDGRLILLPLEEKITRASQAKERLERLSETKIRGFRAPLLQHSLELLTAVGKAGYEYDSSVPSWEALSPTSMKPHGVGTVFPVQFDGIWEIPVSLPQDHQLIRIQSMTPKEAVDHTSHLAHWIRSLNGSCILLVHPDYDYALDEHEKDYRRLIESFRRDFSCDIMTMKEMADWWEHRSNAKIETVHGEPQIVSGEGGKNPELAPEGLGLEFVTGYDDAGFRVEAQL